VVGSLVSSAPSSPRWKQRGPVEAKIRQG